MSRAKALLLAAGEGTRLRPLTHVLPKCLVPVGGQPLLAHWVHALEQAGVTEALINTHAHATLVRGYVAASNQRHATRLIESHEPELLGSAGTIAANPAFADDADVVLIVYTDNFSGVDLRDLLRFHATHADPFTMLLFRASNPTECGIATLDNESRIIAFEEKPLHPAGDLANAGIYVVDSQLYRDLAATRAFDISHDLLPRYVGRIRGHRFDGFHLDIGSPHTYRRAQQDDGAWAFHRFHADGKRRAAIFFDRDGTLIDNVPYLSNPDEVRLVPDAAATLRRFRDAGFACVVTTNQSAVGRGMMSEDDLRQVHKAFEQALAAQGAAVDAIYHCPVKPRVADRRVVEDIHRKPGPGMLWCAASDLGLDVRRSWMVGDMISDVLAGRYAGCRGSIWLNGQEDFALDDGLIDHMTIKAPNLLAAADEIMRWHAASADHEGSGRPGQ